MYKKGVTRILGAFLATVMVLSQSWGAILGEASVQYEPIQKAPAYSMAPISTVYEEYLANGSEAAYVPSSIDFSYLSEATYSASNETFPSSYDLRTLGKSTPVRDQGQLGTCWAQGALASAESGLVERYPLIDFSERHLAWFTYAGDRAAEFFGPVDDAFQFGGFNQSAVAILAQWMGVVFEKDAPYAGEPLPEDMRYQSEWHLQDAYYLPQLPANLQDDRVDDAVIKSILMEDGAVSVGYQAAHYNEAFNEATNAWYNASPAEGDHIVTCIGWDDNYSKENFLEGNRPEKDGAWLCKNSWGVSWGDNGYFWLSYEDKTMSDGTFYRLETKDNYDNMYQYDLTGWSGSIGYESTTAYAANVFESERNEQLDAVSFYTTDANTAYEISIYQNLTDKTDPTSGTRLTTPQTGTEEYVGYHTIELTTPVLLSEEESFSVVVKLTNAANAAPVAVESSYVVAGTPVPSTLGKVGESFVSEDGQSWEDVYYTNEVTIGDISYDFYVTNACIKAFTNPVRTVTFSEDSGPIAYGSTVTLTAPGAAIYYTLDGTQPTASSLVYNSPLVIDHDMTIKAVAVSNGQAGNVFQETYTQSSAALSALTLDPIGIGDTVQLIMEEDKHTYSYAFLNTTEQVDIIPLGSGTITINGEAVMSGRMHTLTGLNTGANTVEIVSTDTGKLPVTYTLTIYRSPLSFDFAQETILFDEMNYTVNTASDFSGEELSSGDSITAYIGRSLYVQNTEGVITDYTVPERYKFSEIKVDFVNETTTFSISNKTLYSTMPDMSDAVYGNSAKVNLTPGQDLYFQRPAGNMYFASEIVRLEVPTRPAMPADVGIDYIKETTKEAIPSTVMVARNADLSDAWVGEEEPVAVNPGESLYLFYPATNETFCSLPFELIVDTRQAAPAQIPQIAEATDTRIVLEAVEGAEYRCGDGEWQSSPVFAGLTPDTSYTFAIRMAVQDGIFRSEERTVVLSTLSAESAQSTQSSVTTETTPDDTTGTTTSAPVTTTASEAPNTGDSGVGSVAIMALLISAAMIALSKARVK